MGVLADWKQKRERKRFDAEFTKYQKQQKQRELILEWYKLLEPFHRRVQRVHDGKHAQLMALADDLSRNAIRDVVETFIFFGGAWTVILALLFWLGGWSKGGIATLFALGIIGSLILAFKFMRDHMRCRLEQYAEGWWVAHDPFTGKEVYKLMKCPRCRSDKYLRYLEPCEYCDHNIDWEAAKLSRHPGLPN